MAEPGFDPLIVFDWLDSHCTRRPADGRYLTILGRTLEDTHRDTFDRWRLAMATDQRFEVPLGRWDEILMVYGIMLFEFEQWAEELYGWTGELAA